MPSVDVNEETEPKCKTNTQSMCSSKTTAPQLTKVNQYTNTKKNTTNKPPDPKQSTEVINETICLDSDEEETIVSMPKGKALKSTTKLPSTSQSSISQVNTSQNITKIAPKPQNSIKNENNKIRPTPDANAVAKSKLVSSKLDDIIRITEGGKVEILRRAENVPADIKANVAKSQVSSKDKNKPILQKAEQKDIITKKDEDIIDIQSINDSDDESPPPVFQNVVHIPAHKYQEPNQAITVKESETSGPIVNKEVIKPSKTILNKTLPSTEVKKPILYNLLTTKKKILLKYPPSTAPPSKDDDKVIDLTENLHSNDKKIILMKKKDWDKVSGSSKDIIINKVGALYSTKPTSTATSPSIDLT